jgi:ppGpp synthetase/RelA/SpoT-type nucleotidyltranferase
MNFDRYEQTGQSLYAELAATVKLILERSIIAAEAPQPQSIQCRAKSPASLKPKLEKQSLLDSDSIEKEIKDLAGVRLILYTNTDVDRFLNARLIPEGFDVDWKATRIHYPTSENAQQQYQGIHYTVRLSAERLALPEYAKFKGMRCEIQIQTILNHAWAETSHDILYKRPEAVGFGTKAFAAIENRMRRIMDDYLLPAGYELQKVQHDFERLMQGKAWFDRGTLEALGQCDDNNDRHETLSRIREYVLPNYDDIHGIYPDLCAALVGVVRAARSSTPKPIESTFGMLSGRTAEEITTLVLNILDDLRYVDVERTFQSLAQIHEDEPSRNVQRQILQVVEHLAGYNVHIWQRVGPSVQYALAECLARMTPDDRSALRPIIMTAWSAMLHPEMHGTSSQALDRITISTGPVLASDALRTIRDRAITGLLELWDQSSSTGQYRETFSELTEAMRTPSQSSYSNELCAMILGDTKRIVESIADRLVGKPYELLEHIEHRLLFEYHRARDIREDPQDRLGCHEIASNLMIAILAVRDRLNGDEQFVRYKTLIGFEAVLPAHWENERFDFEGGDQYRRERALEYVASITDETEEEWYRFLSRCAATESNDLATFPVFGDFLVQLAKAKPATTIRFVRRDDAALMKFLPAFFKGLSESAADADYRGLLADYVLSNRHLAAIVRHYRATISETPAQVRDILEKAAAVRDDIAVIECLIFAIEQHDPQTRPLVEEIFVPAIQHLNERKDARWVDGAWFIPNAKVFFSSLPSAYADLVLENLLFRPKIDDHVETLLVYIAEAHPRAVWEFFGRRIARSHDVQGERYQAFPYSFHGLERPLGQDANESIAHARSWFHAEDALFRFEGARLLSAVFPGFPEPFAAGLRSMGENGSDEDLSFILAVMQNYHGEPATHPLLQAVVARLTEDDRRLEEVNMAMQSTGGVWGEFGIVEALRRKREEAAPWLDDPRPKVKAFGVEYRRRMDGRIAAEQRRAEQEHELRKRTFEADGAA